MATNEKEKKIFGLYWPENLYSSSIREDVYLETIAFNYAKLFWYFGGNRSQNTFYKEDNSDEDYIYVLEYLVNSARKFGIDLPEPQEGKHIVNAQAIAWFKFLFDYFYVELDHGQRDTLGKHMDSLLFKGKDISRYMPKGNWKDLLEKDYYLIELLLGRDILELKTQANKENRLNDLIDAYDKLNNMSWWDICVHFIPNTYDINLLNYGIRPQDDELDEIIGTRPKYHGIYIPHNIINEWAIVQSKKCTAPELFSIIKYFSEWKRFKDLCANKRPVGRDEDIEYVKEYLMYQTRRFGVEFDEPKVDEPLAISSSYQDWYNFYNDFYFGKHNEKEAKFMLESISDLRPLMWDYSKYMPADDWKKVNKK